MLEVITLSTIGSSQLFHGQFSYVRVYFLGAIIVRAKVRDEETQDLQSCVTVDVTEPFAFCSYLLSPCLVYTVSRVSLQLVVIISHHLQYGQLSLHFQQLRPESNSDKLDLFL